MDMACIFNPIRDIPYRIPLRWGEEDNCCSGKHERLLKILQENGYEARYRVCLFHWSGLGLPKGLLAIPHDDDCTHTYLEVKIGGKWKALDATWDSGLHGIMKINEWDGKSSAMIAVKSVKIFSPKKSMEIVNGQTKNVIENDLRRNREFYKAFNEWLEGERHRP